MLFYNYGDIFNQLVKLRAGDNGIGHVDAHPHPPRTTRNSL